MPFILHFDIDYFFAQVEEILNPALRGKPVVIGADPKDGTGRGVVSTANYEARKFGIRSALPISTAYRLNPQAIFLRGRFELYEKFSLEVMKTAQDFMVNFPLLNPPPPLEGEEGGGGIKFEQGGSDEAYMDISSAGSWDAAKEFGINLQKNVQEKTKLSVSVGIGANRIVAKIASDFKKPHGLTIIKPYEFINLIGPLHARKLPGIGPKTMEKLEKMGIRTVADLAKADIDFLCDNFGNAHGTFLHATSHGNGDTEVGENAERKSLSREHTFSIDTNNQNVLEEQMLRLSQKVYEDLREEDFYYRTVTIKVRYENFETHTSAVTLPHDSQDLSRIENVSWKLLENFLRTGRNIRLIGIRLSKLDR